MDMAARSEKLKQILTIWIHVNLEFFNVSTFLSFNCLVTSDGNQMNILNLSEAVMKPVTFMMSLLPGMMMNSNALTEK